MGGDYDEILSEGEKISGEFRSQALMNAFCDALFNCDLTDLGFHGPISTWPNNRTDPNTIRCRLDHFCGNSGVMEFAPSALVEHLDFSESNHAPILLRLRGKMGLRTGRKRRPWHFNAHWVRKEECEVVV